MRMLHSLDSLVSRQLHRVLQSLNVRLGKGLHTQSCLREVFASSPSPQGAQPSCADSVVLNSEHP